MDVRMQKYKIEKNCSGGSLPAGKEAGALS